MNTLVSSVVFTWISCLCSRAYEFEWVTTFPGNGSSVAAIVSDAQTNTIASGSWSNVTAFPISISNRNYLTLPAGEAGMFFQLMVP